MSEATSRAAGPIHGLSVLTEDECWDLLTTTTVGRVAFVGSRGLQLLPVNFRIQERSVFFKTTETGLLAELATYSGEVLFEVDYHGDIFPFGWSVVIRGTSVADETSANGTRTIEHLKAWAGDDRTLVIRIDTAEISGRRVHAS